MSRGRRMSTTVAIARNDRQRCTETPYGFAHYSVGDGGVLAGEIGRSNQTDKALGKETLTKK